jgi:hypothetical protein
MNYSAELSLVKSLVSKSGRGNSKHDNRVIYLASWHLNNGVECGYDAFELAREEFAQEMEDMFG